MDKMHDLLKRQLKEFFGEDTDFPADLRGFLESVNEAYTRADADRDSEERFRSLFNLAPDAVLLLELVPGGPPVILDINLAAVSMYGYTHEELTGKPITFLDDPRSAMLVQERIDKITAGGKALFEVSHVRRDGVVIPLEASAQLVRIRNRNCILAIHRNISAHREMEGALRESGERFSALFNQASDAIFLIDPSDRKGPMIVDANEAACRMHGYGKEELIGKPLVFLHDPASANALPRRINHILKGEKLLFEASHVRKDGSLFTLEVSAHQVNIGGRTFIQSIDRDITARRKMEAALRESEERFRSFFESSRDGIFFATKNLVFTNLNRAAIEMSGYSPEEMFRIDPGVFFESPADMGILLKNLDTAGFVRDYRVKLRRKDGSLAVIELSANTVRNSGGITTGYQGIVKDITQEIALEEQLKQSHKLEAIGQLAGGIAHDFNNILTIILGNAELALMHLDPGSPVTEELSEIKKSGERASNLVSQLLAFSRKQPMKPVILDINNVLTELYRMLQRLIGEDMELRFIPGRGISFIEADRGQIEQIMINLIINARDAIREGGGGGERKITVETGEMLLDEEYAKAHLGSKPGKHVIVSVTDTGVGMNRSVLNKIFDPFFTTKEPNQGTGLGLSIVFGIVRQNGGSIYVYSEPGRGTAFKIFWPAAEETEEENIPDRERFSSLAGHETILVVEDEETLRMFTYHALKEFGYDLIMAPNGREALRLAREYPRPIHLLFADIVTPDINGNDLADILLKEIPNLKVMFTSGYSENIIFGQYLKDESAAFIAKPYNIYTLGKKLRELLDGAV